MKRDILEEGWSQANRLEAPEPCVCHAQRRLTDRHPRVHARIELLRVLQILEHDLAAL